MFTDNPKLELLAEQWDMDIEEMLKMSVFDSVAPGICQNPGCDYSTEVEPDQRAGWCEVCDTKTVKSCLRLSGLA